MSHSDKHPTKKQKIQARNKRDQRVNAQEEFHDDFRKKAREFEEEIKENLAREPERDAEGEVVWSARLQHVRNRLNGKKRMASERWNRFAGTAGGGGRGL
jgi:hypothetical protein